MEEREAIARNKMNLYNDRDEEAACSLNGSDRFDNETLSASNDNMEHRQNRSKGDINMNINDYDERELSLPSISDSESNETD